VDGRDKPAHDEFSQTRDDDPIALWEQFHSPLSHFAVGVFRARSSAVQVDGDQMAPRPTSTVEST
jgi:hypothetical protein